MDPSHSSTPKYDLTVAYRIYPKTSKRPIRFAEDKLKLSRFCLRSFRNGLGNLRAKVHVLLDGCPPEYETMFQETFDARDLVFHRLAGEGNFATFRRQVDLLCRQEETRWVYFAEDDYFYRANQMTTLLQFAQSHPEADFLTPYNHPLRQTSPFHSVKARTLEWGGVRWTQSVATCLTFLARKSAVQDCASTLKTYGRWQHDASLWLCLTGFHVRHPIRWLRFLFTEPHSLAMVALAWRNGWKHGTPKRRYSLWTPSPSLATHMESTGIAPDVDWETEFERIQ